MQLNWFHAAWPLFGLGGAIVIISIMLMTDTFRSGPAVSRWHDPVWLGWLAAPLYWVHQFEEYSLVLLGFNISFQEIFCKTMGFAAYPNCPIPLSFYPVLNIALMWVGAPLAAYLGRRNVMIGLSFWGVILLNGVAHMGAAIALRSYNPGLLSGLLLFVPLSIWVLYGSVIRGPHSGRVMDPAFAGGILSHLLLGVGLWLLKIGAINGTGLPAFSVVLGFTPILFAVLAIRFVKSDLLRPHALP